MERYTQLQEHGEQNYPDQVGRRSGMHARSLGSRVVGMYRQMSLIHRSVERAKSSSARDGNEQLTSDDSQLTAKQIEVIKRFNKRGWSGFIRVRSAGLAPIPSERLKNVKPAPSRNVKPAPSQNAR